MLLHATECEEEDGRLSCTDVDKSSARTWEDAWRELEIALDEGKFMHGHALCGSLSISS